MSVRLKQLTLMSVLVSIGVLGMAGAAVAQVRTGSVEQQLFTSVQNNDMTGVRAALDGGANVFATNRMGNRAADVAVDMGLFDVAHYLLSVMDHKRAAQKARVQKKSAQDPVVERVQAQPATEPQAVVQAPPPAPVAPAAPIASGPNPFAVGTGIKATASPKPMSVAQPNTSPKRLSDIIDQTQNDPQPVAVSPPVSLSKPVVRISAAKPVAPAVSQSKSMTAPAIDPKSTLHIAPTVDREEQAGAMPVVAKIPAAKPPAQVAQAAPVMPSPVTPPLVAPEPVAAKPETLQPSAAQAEEQGWFGKMTSFFQGDDDDAKPADPTPVEAPTAVVSIPIPRAPEAPSASPSAGAAQRPLIQLTSFLSLGKGLPAKPKPKASAMKVVQEWPCVSKGQWGVVCLEQASWPDGLNTYFGKMRSSLYRGSKVVVGYEDGRADFIYAAFRSHGFDEVIEVFTERLGPPDLINQRGVRPFGQTLEANPVRTWYGFDPKAGREIALEIFKYDDQRGTFPVMDEGAVKLSYVGEENIFRYTIPIELQRFN